VGCFVCGVRLGCEAFHSGVEYCGEVVALFREDWGDGVAECCFAVESRGFGSA
jgi:hypothetical protein